MTNLGSNAVSGLFHEALLAEMSHNKNLYLTQKMLVNRVYKRIKDIGGIHEEPVFTVTADFYRFHEEIYTAYELKKHTFTAEEQNCNERVLGKDSPSLNELLKFATCWIKHDSHTACKWFAVDGILGNCPKLYVREAFNPHFEKHTQTIRALYRFIQSPDQMKEVMEVVFGKMIPEKFTSTENVLKCEPSLLEYVNFYISEVGEDEINLLYAERQGTALKRQKNIEKYQMSKKRKVIHEAS